MEQLRVEDKIQELSDGEEEVIKRRGKRRKKRGRDSSRGPLAVQASIDPETQVFFSYSNLIYFRFIEIFFRFQQ